MNSTQSRGPVSVGVSRSEASDSALLWAADEAAWRGLTLLLIHAQEWPTGTSPRTEPDHPAHLWSTHFRATGERLLEEARARAVERHPGLVVTTKLAEGRTVRVLREAAEHASQLVLGVRRLTESDILFAAGGKGLSLVGHTPCPIALVPQQAAEYVTDGPVVVGVDGSAASERAVEMAFEEAVRGDVGLLAVEVRRPREAGLPDFLEEARLDVSQALAGWSEKYPDTDVQWEVLTGHPALMLATASRRARCLVVASRGLGGFRGMVLGSTSRGLVHRTHCPLLVVPAGQAR
ncbi:nucleotide-binding universal stress UspA family protein [Streptacidiphilus sp. MAP12-16]|uniref:universal stress protein n=1 Tax=Streptacidiphilus sp. MAP12-16 TaxID=3156300 RepID=UPI0035179245